MPLLLSDLLSYKSVVIQCHDNPDADTIASGYSLWWYFKKNGVAARVVYGGKQEISKSNLLLMIDILNIPLEHVIDIEAPDLLVTVDCQYGESNVTKYEASQVAVIDHHQVTGQLPSLELVKSNYGACSTVIYELLREEGININDDQNIATALYYGLLTDTNGLTEISHPADKDLRDFSRYKKQYITLFRNSNLSRNELELAGHALMHAKYDDARAYAIVSAEPCDPNILGVISDMLLEVDSVHSCLVYSILPFGVKISVRSCVKEIKACELASYIANKLGGGGGHLIKAGGFLQKELIENLGYEYSEISIQNLMLDRMNQYFDNTQIISTDEFSVDLKEFRKFRKKELSLGYVRAKDVASVGTTVTIRTMEGDVDVSVTEDLYIVLGIEGEIYPIRQNTFESGYRLSNTQYSFPGEYEPAIINAVTGDRYGILSHANACVSIGRDIVYAKQIDNRMKIFTEWDRDQYYLGIPGDYMAVREDDLTDIYIIAEHIFGKTYELYDVN